MNSPVQAAPVARGYVRVHQVHTLTQQGCNPFVCGAAVITCAAACIACLGPAYESCKDCF
jgi:hypothetical protein